MAYTPAISDQGPSITLIPTSTDVLQRVTPAPSATVSVTVRASGTLHSATPAPKQTETVTASLLSRVAQSTTLPVYSYQIVDVFPHDRGAYTQGLVFEDGFLYEGTGLRGESTLRKVELETGNPLQLHFLPDEYFGEGITIWADQIIQLTWTAGLGFLYDKASFESLDTFHYATEGWGITHDGTRLIMSDGTAILHFWDPVSLDEVGQVVAHDEHGPLTWLNELEYVQGMVYANVWQTEAIAIIDPEDGQVTGWIDLKGLLKAEDRDPPVGVLNGIAYDSVQDRLFVTGKNWPKLFEIELVRRWPCFLPCVGRAAETTPGPAVCGSGCAP
jgi:glutamine cyclotransferase